jgi:hypothetical protein
MTPVEATNVDLSPEGHAFARRQAMLSSPEDPKQFRRHVFMVTGSAFAVARYAEEQIRAEQDRVRKTTSEKQVREARDPSEPAAKPVEPLPGIRRLKANTRVLRGAALEIESSLRALQKLPFARSVTGAESPRIIGVGQSLLSAAKFRWSPSALSSFVEGYQSEEPLAVRELWALPIALKLALLEEILAQASGAFGGLPASDAAVDASVLALQQVSMPVWANLLEPLVPFESVLREDPAGAYPRMDFDSRELYRTTIQKFAEQSSISELEIAKTALAMAQEAARQTYHDPRIAARRSHVGYFLIDDGQSALRHRCGFRPRVRDRIRFWMRSDPDDFYIGGIVVIALLAMAAAILPLVSFYNPLGTLALAFIFLLLPISQFAVELVNHTVTTILKPQILTKLDFSRGIPDDCKTLVAIPTLLLNEQQVRDLVGELEVRSLANQDRNVHYALVTDLADSTERPRDGDTSPLVALAGSLIDDLNRRYAGSSSGRFLMLHRHRIFNPRQGVWMGWERKRGKLLDLNRLVMGGMDSFPFKAGDCSVLQGLRYIFTLDSDTKLPRDSVHRMVGAIAHPLNQAVLDPQRRIVAEGYAILQPRVGVTVKSAARSRLASLFSGETGLDIYTRAISDVYQDLYGAGTFTGKGLYEIRVLHEVLDRRFPRNFLLSHDLIEGAYGRVGLVTDIEVLDDYPSHYSAQNRRKHRWVRGDWQILRWLLDRVPNESGESVRNPISTISRWKILDNLRRSLVEPATLLLFVMGWLWLPGTARYWTITALLIVFVPVLVQFVFSIGRALAAEQNGHIRKTIRDSLGSMFSAVLNFVFLGHQTLLMADAIVRSLIRSFVTGEHLLEWETAAQAETGGGKRTPVETTMRLTPVLSLLIGLLVWWVRPEALPWAVPILVIWALAKPVSLWLNHPRGNLTFRLSDGDRFWLRKVAWRTWRYFETFTNEQNHGIVPDNVQMTDSGNREAQRFSPTNAGLQLNARQAAVVLGYLSLPEYAAQTLANLKTLESIPKWHGHLLNWYTTDTLQPIAPYVVSTVDSGNFLASLCSLRMGTIDFRQTALLPALRQGLMDLLADADKHSAFAAAIRTALTGKRKQPSDTWVTRLLPQADDPSGEPEPAHARVHAIAALVREYLPWLDPKYSELWSYPELKSAEPLDIYTPETAFATCRQMHTAVTAKIQHDPERNTPLAHELVTALAMAEGRLGKLLADLDRIAEMAEEMLHAADFQPLLDPNRRLLSIGYDTAKEEGRLDSCYDLLASEARTAAFLAVAKGDVQQETWFRADRRTTLVDGRPVLMSWAGTMFEYLMPALWLQTWPDTLLAQSLSGAVRAQRRYVAHRRTPWGISEAGHSERDAEGNYQYHAFGVPTLALNPPPLGALVIAPYASMLALEADPVHAIENLRRMNKLGWFGEFGFYESADYSANREPRDRSRYVLVRSWMAHHQGMSLLAVTNLTEGHPFQRWFHNDPRVRATELLLYEKPIEFTPTQQTPHADNISFQPDAIEAAKA